MNRDQKLALVNGMLNDLEMLQMLNCTMFGEKGWVLCFTSNCLFFTNEESIGGISNAMIFENQTDAQQYLTCANIRNGNNEKPVVLSVMEAARLSVASTRATIADLEEVKAQILLED